MSTTLYMDENVNRAITAGWLGYDNLWVVDGAVIPEAIGKNPSRTIAAVAERAADLVE